MKRGLELRWGKIAERVQDNLGMGDLPWFVASLVRTVRNAVLSHTQCLRVSVLNGPPSDCTTCNSAVNGCSLPK